MTYHAIEIATEECYHLYAGTDKVEVDAHFAELLEMIGDQVETYCLGEVDANSNSEALNKIRDGDWHYTQFG